MQYTSDGRGIVLSGYELMALAKRRELAAIGKSVLRYRRRGKKRWQRLRRWAHSCDQHRGWPL